VIGRTATAVAIAGVVLIVPGCSGTAGDDGRAEAETSLSGSPSAHCDRWAAPTGKSKTSGSAQDPLGSAQALVDRLRPGEVGCLRGGIYREDVVVKRGGRPGSPVELRSAPGARASLNGTLWVSDTANDVVIAYVNLDGSNRNGSPSPQINGDRVVFRANDVTNRHTGICFILGGAFTRYGLARDVVIDRNRIHDCGRLPRTNHDHGIYVEGSRGARITNNVIYGNADYGIHLYPDADDTYVAHNLVQGNGGGVIVAGAEGGEYPRAYTSDDNLVERNVISVARGAAIETSWDLRPGQGNLARHNCLSAGGGPVDARLPGLVLADNLDRAVRDTEEGGLRVRRRSPCARLGAGPRR